MMIMNTKEFERNIFAVQLISKGSYVDDVNDGVDSGKSYLIETYVIRLNPTALNDWILSEMMNSRDVYDSNEEWEAHKVKYKNRRNTVNNKIINSLGLNEVSGGICITQSQSEVFTVVHVRELS
ncbi:MAG: hypothetical protein AB7V48_04160 [Sedimentibacter sp.]